MTRHYPYLSSGTSSVWNFCSRFSDVGGVAKCRLFLRLARITFYESLLIGQKTSALCKYKASDRKAWFDMTVFVCLLTDVALFFIFNSRRARERKIYFLLPPPLPHCASGHLITCFLKFLSRALGGRLRENRGSLNRLVFVNARNLFLLGRFCKARCLGVTVCLQHFLASPDGPFSR